MLVLSELNFISDIPRYSLFTLFFADMKYVMVSLGVLAVAGCAREKAPDIQAKTDTVYMDKASANPEIHAGRKKAAPKKDALDKTNDALDKANTTADKTGQALDKAAELKKKTEDILNH